MRKTLLAFLIMVLFGTSIITFYYIPKIWRTEPHKTFSPHTPESQGSETEQFVELKVDLYSQDGEWIRSQIDLPLYTSTVAYTVSNSGTATADDIQVTIYIGGVVFKKISLASLASYHSFTDEFSISVNYDDSKEEVSLTASSEGSTDTDTLTINAILPRSPSSHIARLYITPQDPIVKQTLNNILKKPLYFDWMEIRDWVADKIDYPPDDADGDGEPDYDYIKHGQWEYWQLPRETLSLRTGDCEDYSILLCTLLRANGWDEDRVYVVLGKDQNGKGHAWVKLNVDIIGWRYIEPQIGGVLNTFIGDPIVTLGYTAEYIFNDVYFETA